MKENKTKTTFPSVKIYPQVSILTRLISKEDCITVVGGFTDKGFFLKNTYELVKESKDDNLDYYSYVKKIK